MKAIVEIPFRGVPDGEHRARDLELGEVIEGDLAKVALEQGWAIPEGTRSVIRDRETQALGGAPSPFRETAPIAVRRRRVGAKSHA
jgi:hypothetical protein